MRLAFWLAVLLSASTVQAQTRPDSLRRLPDFRIPVRGDYQPPQTSAGRAYLYSAAATGVLVGTGYLLYNLSPQTDPDGGAALTTAGGILMGLGVMGGPMVGNLSLGAGSDARRGALIKAVGVGVGATVVLFGVASATSCIVEPDCGTGALDAVEVGAVIMGVGIVGGTVYDLATIPGNARWAQRARANGGRVPVALVPGYDPRYDAPMLALRVGL